MDVGFHTSKRFVTLSGGGGGGLLFQFTTLVKDSCHSGLLP